MRIITILLFVLTYFSSFSQSRIEIFNPSFEGAPTQGIRSFGYYTQVPEGWVDCGQYKFPNETPPDIHPGGFWEVTISPSDGESYLGMVVRSNETWESITQRLNVPIEKNNCYEFDLDLCRSDHYWSSSRSSPNKKVNYITPVVLRVWIGDGLCEQSQLIGESYPVDHSEWDMYIFEFRADLTAEYITLEAFYDQPVLEPYEGHILVDNMSDIDQIDCK